MSHLEEEMEEGTSSNTKDQQTLPKMVRKRNTTTSIPVGPSDDDMEILKPSASPFIKNFSASSATRAAQVLIATDSVAGSTIPRAQTTIRTAAVFFFVGFIWHSTILPFVYKQMGPEIAALIQLSGSHVDAFRDPPNLDPKILREFGLAGAASHTIIFMFGFICATALRTLKFSTIVRNDTGRWEPIGIGVSLVIVVWTAAVFHVLAQAFCRYAFETKFGPVYNYAVLFYEETNGKTPFAWASSISFTTALLLGFLISTDFHMNRFERVVLFPLVNSKQSSLSVLGPFAVWLGLLDSVLIPFSETFFSKALVGYGLGSDDVVNGSHAFAFAIGLMMMFAGTARTMMQDGRCCQPSPSVLLRRRSTKDLAVDAELESDDDLLIQQSSENTTFDGSNMIHIFQATSMTLFFSSTLLASALFKGDTALDLVFRTLWRPAGLAFVFGLGWIALLRITFPSSSQVVDYMIDQNHPKRRQFFTGLLIFGLWNAHYFPFFSCFIPFQLFALAFPTKEYSLTDAFWDGFLYTFTGPYLGPVLVQGILKMITAKMKMQWGLLQESLLAIFILLPACITLWFRWYQGHVALPIYFFMSACEFLYLLTWRNRPEYSGWRNWPELKSTRLWILIEDYFSVRMIVDGEVDSASPEFQSRDFSKGRFAHTCPIIPPHVPRIMGFHPHGIFPCTVVWMHLIPLWGKVFGKLIPYQLTDAFTHVPPLMREVMQWSGGREITKGVMNAMLSSKETLIIVPGGQSEMLKHSYENSRDKKIVLCAKHRGFIRVAMENRAELVPIISFGELIAITNIEMPTLQRWSKKLIGFPAPFVPVGVGGILPFPVRTPFTIVFGRPIDYFSKPVDGKQKVVFQEEDVEIVYRMYFEEVKELFNKYKKQAGFGDWEVVLNGYQDEK